MKKILIAILLVSGCVQGQITEPSICSSHSITFPGLPINPGIQLPPITETFTAPTGIGKNWITKAMLVSGDLTIRNGMNFNFLDELMLSVVDPNSNDDLVLWDVQHPDAIILPLEASDRNLVNYIDSNNNLTIKITASTQHPPTASSTLDIAFCLSAEIDKTYTF